jgi:hypothetical protein
MKASLPDPSGIAAQHLASITSLGFVSGAWSTSDANVRTSLGHDERLGAGGCSVYRRNLDGSHCSANGHLGLDLTEMSLMIVAGVPLKLTAVAPTGWCQ